MEGRDGKSTRGGGGGRGLDGQQCGKLQAELNLSLF